MKLAWVAAAVAMVGLLAAHNRAGAHGWLAGSSDLQPSGTHTHTYLAHCQHSCAEKGWPGVATVPSQHIRAGTLSTVYRSKLKTLGST